MSSGAEVMLAPTTYSFKHSFLAFKTAVMHTVEALAVALLLIESLILFISVVFRYFLHSPLVWSDELAQSLFIWLCMLGAVVALNRSEHMRLTAVVSRLSPFHREWLETFGLMVVLVFACLLIEPGFTHASEQMAVTSPALNVPDGFRASAIPVGFGLVIFVALAQLIERSTLRSVLVSAAVIGGIWFVIDYFAYDLYDLGNLNLVLFFVVMLGAAVVCGVPIAFAFGISTLAYVVHVAEVPSMIIVSRIDEGVSHMVLLSVPLFIFLGALLQLSGMAKVLIDFMSSLLGHVRGGLNYVLLGAMFLVSGISGSKVADMAAVAPALFPEMKKRGADEHELAALLSATGAMTETIPPSLVLITVGAVCGVSISALFIGGLLPAFVCTVAIASVCAYKSRKISLKGVKRAPMSQVMRTLMYALPVIFLPILIRFCVVNGIATATEVAAIGIVYVIAYALIMQQLTRSLDFSNTYKLLVEACSLSGAILLIIGAATAMAWALTQSGFSSYLVEHLTSMPGGAVGFLLVSIVVFILLGSMLEGIPAIVLFGPLVFPAAQSLGIHDVHYAMVIILSMGIGLFAPPLGIGFYAASAISKVNADHVMPKSWTYLAVLLVTTIFIALVPWISIAFL